LCETRIRATPTPLDGLGDRKSAEPKAPISFGKIVREIAAHKVEACEAARDAMAKAPHDGKIVIKHMREPPAAGNRFGTEVIAIEAVSDAGTASLLPRYESYGLDVLPAVLPAARALGLVVEYWDDGELLQRFDPEVPLMFRSSQPLDDALGVLTIVLFPLAILGWVFVAFQGLAELREMLVDFYVPGVRSTWSIVVEPGRLTGGTTHYERAQLVAIVRFRSPKSWWVYVGVVTRDTVLRLGDGATSARESVKLEREQIALADVLSHVLASDADAPYR
jgi:hypothetical protein